MAYLHYGAELRLDLDAAASKIAGEAIGAHATRGGWVSVTDKEGRTWSLLITTGIPIWMNEDE
ncbi:MAG TPA: hypothetical protein VGH01_05680 [Jatrophihabitantaceae bacterium]|jgi:hypothetical protein